MAQHTDKKPRLTSHSKQDAPWVEKFRPKSLDEVAAHKEIIDTIRRLVNENRLPHLLLYGPPGTGKTSTILAVARQMYGGSMGSMVLELNASDDRGIGIVRQQIQDFVSTRTIFSTKFKLVILDECDAMTKDAQFALRRVIEKYTRNARFCLICNYVSKIIPALQSRCTRFRFPPLGEQHVRERLQHVIDSERYAPPLAATFVNTASVCSVDLGEKGMEALITLGAGDMRRTLNILQLCQLGLWLQSTHMASPTVDENAVYLNTGNPLPQDIETCAHWLFNEPFTTVFQKLSEMQVTKGLALLDIVQQLHPWVFRIEMPSKIRIELIDRMADVEYRLAYGTSEKLQLGALVGAFSQAAEALIAVAK